MNRYMVTSSIAPFISKTHDLIQNAPNELIEWTTDGSGFVVKEPKRLEKEVLHKSDLVKLIGPRPADEKAKAEKLAEEEEKKKNKDVPVAVENKVKPKKVSFAELTTFVPITKDNTQWFRSILTAKLGRFYKLFF